MSDKFSRLPTELKLFILQLLDSQTIRQCVSLINKEFNKLSRDYTLYQEYKIAEYDVPGDKLRVELKNELYRLQLESLTVTNDYLNDRSYRQVSKPHLEPFLKLKYLTVISDSTVSLTTQGIPGKIKNIRVRGRLSTDSFPAQQHLIPFLKEVDIVCIRDERYLEEKLEIPARLHLMKADLFASDEFLNRFLRGDLADIRKQKHFGVEIDEHTNPTAQNNVLNHLAGNVVEIQLRLDCSNADDRDTVKVICRECTSLNSLTLFLENIEASEEVREVRCTKLETLKLIGSYQETGVEVLMRFQLLIQAAQHAVNLVSFSSLSLEVLNWVSDSLESLTLSLWTFYDTDVQVGELSSKRSLNLKDMYLTADVVAKLLNPNISKLECDARCFEPSFLNTLTVLEEVTIVSFKHILEVLEALLPSKNTLRIFKCGYKDCPSGEDILKLLRQFRRMQYAELTGREIYRKEEIVELFPAAIVTITDARDLGLKVQIFF